LLFVLYFIYEKVFQGAELDWRIQSFGASLDSVNEIALLSFAVVLLLANWGLEALKWQLVLRHSDALSFAEAFKGVFAGVSTSIITPNRVGEFVGKVVFLPAGKRMTGAGLSFVNSLAQLLMTFFFGALALSFVELPSGDDEVIGYLKLFLGVIWLLTALIAILFFFLPSLLPLLKNVPLLRSPMQNIETDEMPGFQILLRILVLSALRYGVFGLQFLLMLRVFTQDLHLGLCLQYIPLMYLGLAIAPTLSLGELGVREFLALNFIGYASSDEFGIFLSSTFIWIVNIGIPAAVGAILLQSARIVEE
jgi:hypothetical protein